MVAEPLRIVPYDPAWRRSFADERARLLGWIPGGLVRRIEHFGSTAVPGLVAKPVIDLLVEVTDLETTKARIAPILEREGYDYFWRPTFGDDGLPFYAWFVRRDLATGERTHHIHMVEASFASHWERLLFRDYLVDHPAMAREYGELKIRLAEEYPTDRIGYTRGKTGFVERVTAEAKRWYAEVELRDVSDTDLPTLYEHQADPVAAAMVGCLPREREAFVAHWTKIRGDEAALTKAVLWDGRLAGNVLSFETGEGREVGYWIGREFWGRGVATRALRSFLTIEVRRPLAGRTARHNAASLRVLERCGFRTVREEEEEFFLRLGDGS